MCANSGKNTLSIGFAVSSVTRPPPRPKRAFTKSASSRTKGATILEIIFSCSPDKSPSRNTMYSWQAAMTPSCIDAPLPSIELVITRAPARLAIEAV